MTMLKVIKTKVMISALLVFGALVAKAAEPEVVITDDLAPHTPVRHIVQFATTLSASVKNPPESNEEATITGPTWKWSIVSQSKTALFLSSSTGQTVGLQSHLPPRYQMEGTYSATVQAIATFKRKLNAAPHTETSIPIPGSIEVKFFVKAPKIVKNVSDDLVHGFYFTPEGKVGHQDTYNFIVLDNQPTPQLYIDGQIREAFSNYQPNPLYENDLAAQGAPGPEITFPLNNGAFSDVNEWYANPNNAPPWSRGSFNLTQALGPDDFWFRFSQTFHCEEDEPPYPSSTKLDTSLVPIFSVTHRRDYVER